MCNNQDMQGQTPTPTPTRCPVCQGGLLISKLYCPFCDTQVAGSFSLSRLAGLPEPHASLVELFLRVRGNMKEMERELGLSYPTVRARLEEALTAAGFGRDVQAESDAEAAEMRRHILDKLERGELSATEAAERLRELRAR